MTLYRKRKEGGREPYDGHPAAYLMHDEPNEEQTSFEFREMLMGHLILRGNAYVFKEMTVGGELRQLIPLHPARMKVERLKNGAVAYTYTHQDGIQEVFGAEEIWHLRGLSSDGLMGLSISQLAQRSIGLTLTMEQYSDTFYANNTLPGSIAKYPGKLSEGARDKLKRSFQEYRATQRGATLILEEGLDWAQVGMSQTDAQYIETRSFNVRDVARWLNIPLVLMGEDDKAATYAASEQFFMAFIKHTLLPWAVRWEKSAGKNLLSPKERRKYFWKMNMNAFERASIKSRYAAYVQGLQNGFLSPNDIRELEDMNPIEEGDDYYRPMNLIELGEEPPEKTVAAGEKLPKKGGDPEGEGDA